jgi:hypothetical protein
MPVDPERYKIFEIRPPDEEQWASREELFNAHGYNFRPRLRRDWVPSWRGTGESPLHREDGQVSRVFRPLYHPHHPC